MDKLEFLDKRTLAIVISAVRKSFCRHSPEYAKALSKVVDYSGPRGGRRWYCEKCGLKLAHTETFVDHIEPIIPLNQSVINLTFKELYERCWTTSDNLQVLCKPCHMIKSKQENKERREYKNLLNPKHIKVKKQKLRVKK